MRLLFVFLCSCLMVVPVGLFAQSTPAFTHFTPQNGLPSSEVYQVVCDQMGYLWFATDHGLARYNGYVYWFKHDGHLYYNLTVILINCRLRYKSNKFHRLSVFIGRNDN